MAHVADFETWQNLYVEFFLQIICVRENNTYQLLQVLRQLKNLYDMTYKNVFAKEIWIDKIPLIKKENKDARVTKKQFVMWKNKKTDVKNTPP